MNNHDDFEEWYNKRADAKPDYKDEYGWRFMKWGVEILLTCFVVLVAWIVLRVIFAP